MVTFVCSYCGSALKKNQVEKHTFQCRSKSFSCIDCNKDFIGDEYVAHTKCISEIERYSAKGWQPPVNYNKGEKKQGEWISIVQTALDKHAKSISPSSRNLLHTVAKHDNVPRKKPKFINFINNISRNGFNQTTINEVWDILENEWKSAKQPLPVVVNKPEEHLKDDEKAVEIAEPSANGKKKKKKKKNKDSSPVVEESEEAEVAIPITNCETEEQKDNDGKKKKKKKVAKEVSKETVVLQVTNGDTDVSQNVSKKKRKEKSELVASALVDTAADANEDETNIPKKKKRKTGKIQE